MSDNEEAEQRVKSSVRAKDTEGGGESQMILENSPGDAFMVFIDMNNLSNKLKLLNYEDDYILRWKMRPISRFERKKNF